jgi:hypothetical protein
MALTLMFAVMVACSSGNDDPKATPAIAGPTPQQSVSTATSEPLSPTTVPTSYPTPTDSSDIPRTPTTTYISPTAVTKPPLEVDIATLTVPVCRTTDVASNGVGFGTIPHATPTAIPQSGSSSGGVALEAQAFATSLSPMVEAIVATTRAADDAWDLAASDDDLARVILFEGRRLAQLCSALSIFPLTADGLDIVNIAAKALNDRRAILLETADLLKDQPGNGRGMDTKRQDSSTILIGLETDLDSFASAADVISFASAPFTVVNPLLDLSFDAAAGWLPVRNGIDIVILAPSRQQVYSARGLGPDAWKLGTAVRIRRFRNNLPWELADTAMTMDALYARLGESTDEQSTSVGGVKGILRVYRTVNRDWSTYVATTVLDSTTYLFEYGCQDQSELTCVAQLDRLTNSVVFSNE